MVLQIKTHPRVAQEKYDIIKIYFTEELDAQKVSKMFEEYGDSKVAIVEVSLYSYEEIARFSENKHCLVKVHTNY